MEETEGGLLHRLFGKKVEQQVLNGGFGCDEWNDVYPPKISYFFEFFAFQGIGEGDVKGVHVLFVANGKDAEPASEIGRELADELDVGREIGEINGFATGFPGDEARDFLRGEDALGDEALIDGLAIFPLKNFLKHVAIKAALFCQGLEKEDFDRRGLLNDSVFGKKGFKRVARVDPVAHEKRGEGGIGFPHEGEQNQVRGDFFLMQLGLDLRGAFKELLGTL